MTTTARPSSTLPPAALDPFRRRFHGEVVVPGDSSYDQHRRVWNGSVDRHSALVARCTGPADVVTADGTMVRAEESHDSDLFWGLRGGGGNFGVVTEFEFRLCPVGAQVVAGPVFWPMEDTSGLLRFYRDWIAEAPDELMAIVVQRRAPDIPAVPRELVGRHVVGVAVCYVGDVEEGERVVRPLKEYGAPLLDLCRPKLFVEHQSMFDPGFPHGWWYYVRACVVDALTARSST